MEEDLTYGLLLKSFPIQRERGEEEIMRDRTIKMDIGSDIYIEIDRGKVIGVDRVGHIMK